MSRSVARFCEVALRNVYYLELRRDRACTTHHGGSKHAQDFLVSYMPLAIISGAKFFELKGLVRAVWAVRTGGTPS